MRLPVFAFLRWVQENPKWMRLFDVCLGVISIAIGLWQDSGIWLGMGAICILAALFRLGERVNLFLPKVKPPGRDRDA